MSEAEAVAADRGNRVAGVILALKKKAGAKLPPFFARRELLLAREEDRHEPPALVDVDERPGGCPQEGPGELTGV
jgi:hypothetical protein